jgi:hypothetical protein
MSAASSLKQVIVVDQGTTEYDLSVSGIIEMASELDKTAFFDGLLDAIIAYVEKHNSLAGLTMSYQPYQETNDNNIEADDGGERA